MGEFELTYETAEKLVTDPRFQQLKYFQEKTNVFTIVGQTHTEHWHSAFISWLLDPHSSLRLGHFPLARLLNLCLIKSPDCGFTLRDVYRWNLDEVRFETEKDASMDGKKRSIDVYGESKELIFVIENKVNARENYNGSNVGQTSDYRAYVEKHKLPGQRALYFFITPDPKQRSFDPSYIQVTYQEMFDYIIKKCIQHPQVNTESRYLLEQYANNLREPVHNAPMALVNVELCQEIYEAHGETLRQIFDDVESCGSLAADTRISCVLYRHYQSIFDEIFLSLEDKKFGRAPKSTLRRSSVSIDDLYLAGLIANGTKFSMTYEGVTYYAAAEYDAAERQCYFLVLDENQQPFTGADGNKIGYYTSSSRAAVDLINMYRQTHGQKGLTVSISGQDLWKTSEGKTIRELMDRL